MKKIFLVILVSIFLLSFLCLKCYAQLANTPWPKFRQNLQNTGRSIYIGPESGYVKWRYLTGDGIYSSPAIGSDGTVYVGSDDHNLYAINPDGTLKWKYTTGYVVRSSPAIGIDGTVYVGSNDGYLYAINPDGTLKWKYGPSQSISSSPTIANDGTIYVIIFKPERFVISAINFDGTLKWEYPISQGSDCPAIGIDGSIYVGSSDMGPSGIVLHNLYAINPDGTLKWISSIGGGWNSSSPAIGADGTIFIGTSTGVTAINPDGTLKWAYTIGSIVLSSPAIGPDGTIYASANDCNLYGINPDGTLKWKYVHKGGGESSPAVDNNGIIYNSSCDGNFVAINLDGTLKWMCYKGSGGESSPAIGDNKVIYIGDVDGNICALGELPQITEAHLYNATRVGATDIAIGEQYKIVAKGTPNQTNVLGVIANADRVPPQPGENPMIGTPFILSETSPGSGIYESTQTLTSVLDVDGFTATKLLAAVSNTNFTTSPVVTPEILTVVTLDTEPPSITNPSPTGPIATATPIISATITDNIAVDETSFVLSIKHQTETDYTILCSGTGCSYNKTTGLLSYQIIQSLRVGRWEVKLEAKDKAGNLATLDWNFVITPRAGLSSQTSAMQSLKDQITAFFGSSIERSLVAKIDAAIDSAKRALQALDSQDTKLATNQIKTSQNQLKALINEIKAQLGKKIPEDVGGGWINQAEKIITELENIILFLKGELTTAPVKPKTELTTKNGDLNSDGVVDEKDVEVLKKAFGTKQGDSNFNPACDLNGDGKIDLGDFGVLVKEYNK